VLRSFQRRRPGISNRFMQNLTTFVNHIIYYPLQCHNLAEAHESLIEDWFLNHQKLHGDLHHWLCIKKLKVCCPDHHYGPECLPCPGSSPEMECSSNGKCKVFIHTILNIYIV
jgi:hypothetical protein